jgi:hypothetical protein
MPDLPDNNIQNQEFVLRWKSKYTDASGAIGPISKVLAEAIANSLRPLFSDIDYSVEPAPNGYA